MPKTGGSTLARSFGEQVFKTGHVPWHRTRASLESYEPGLWDRLYKFAFIRNPYDRHLSWFFHNAGTGVFHKQFVGPKRNDFEYLRELFHDWMDPDCTHVHGADGFCMVNGSTYAVPGLITESGVGLKVDYLAKWELFASEVQWICDAIGIEVPEKISLNVSVHRPKTGHYSWWYGGARGARIKGIVAGLGWWELTHQGYTFEDAGESGRPTDELPAKPRVETRQSWPPPKR